MVDYDTELKVDKLEPVYIMLTASEMEMRAGYDHNSNSIAARVNVRTFEKCWGDVFYNKTLGIEKNFVIPKTDRESTNGIYLVWSCTKMIDNSDHEVHFFVPTLSRTLMGLVSEDWLNQFLPKTAEDLRLQRLHFRVDAKP